MRTVLLISLLLLASAASAASAAAEPVGISPLSHNQDAALAPAVQPTGLGQAPQLLRRQPAPLPHLPHQPLADPASSRLVLNRTGDLLSRGQLEVVCRELLGLELGLGLTNWLELRLTTTPLLAFIPGIGPAESFWSADLRLQLVASRVFALTAELSGLAVAGYAGFRAGLAARLGNEQVALHGNVSAARLWSTATAEEAYDCEFGGCGAASAQEQALLIASGGMSVRLARKVKLIFEGLYYRDGEMDALLGSPAVRLHGQRFAADLGLLFVLTGASDEIFALPMINLSVTY